MVTLDHHQRFLGHLFATDAYLMLRQSSGAQKMKETKPKS
jgi:hypothetical protein